MSCLDHWNVVALSRDLTKRPKSVRLDGRDIVLFRTSSGTVAAVDEMCPHRRMKLSAGCVAGDRLQCAYHGWTFDACGHGESPGTPKMHAQTTSYEACERYGFIWLRPRGCDATMPDHDIAGYYALCAMEHEAPVPLELAVDNFCEIEHTPTTHVLFGYELSRMAEVQMDVEASDDVVYCRSDGPHKRLAAWIRHGLFIGRNVGFRSEWSTHFSPVYLQVNHTLYNADTRRQAHIRYRAFVHCTPVDQRRTKIFTLIYMRSTFFPGPYGGIRVIAPWLRRKARIEIDRDCETLQLLADNRPDLEGLKLSRFDRVMGLNRERIDRIYRGVAAEPAEVGNAAAPNGPSVNLVKGVGKSLTP